MPRKVNKGQQAKRTEHYRQMLESTPQLCKSMVYNELYSKLQKDRRLDRFIAIDLTRRISETHIFRSYRAGSLSF